MNDDEIQNPKTLLSGIIGCTPQRGYCPNDCPDCFFNSGRSYIEPIEQNLPHIPTEEQAKGRVVRICDLHDANIDRERVVRIGAIYDDAFYNTSINHDLAGFKLPVVLTINPGKLTDTGYIQLGEPPPNLMFVRIRAHPGNIAQVIVPAIEYYTLLLDEPVPVVLTYMAYFDGEPPVMHTNKYEYTKRVTNSYWCLKTKEISHIEDRFYDNEFVYSCGYKGTHSCRRCGTCLREYYAAKERIREKSIYVKGR